MTEQAPKQRKAPTRQAILERAPWLPPDYELADVISIQAVAAGNADAIQQVRVLKFIVERLAATYDQSYRPGAEGERDTAFAEGRRFVGLQIVKLTKLNPGRKHVETDQGQ